MITPNYSPFLHASVLQDNHYGIRFNHQTANFVIDHTDNSITFACRIHDAEPTAPVSGLHYIVSHTHAHAILATDNIYHLYQRVCWDITLLKKILIEIPAQYHLAIAVLSKEISMDKALKKHIEHVMWFSRQVTNHPSETNRAPNNLLETPAIFQPPTPTALLLLQTSPTDGLPDDHSPSCPPAELLPKSPPSRSIGSPPVILTLDSPPLPPLFQTDIAQEFNGITLPN